MEELEHYTSDCNNSPAMTRELPLSDESKQWIAKDTCSGRDSADTTPEEIHAMELTNTERIRRWNAIRNGDEVVHDE